MGYPVPLHEFVRYVEVHAGPDHVWAPYRPSLPTKLRLLLTNYGEHHVTGSPSDISFSTQCLSNFFKVSCKQYAIGLGFWTTFTSYSVMLNFVSNFPFLMSLIFPMPLNISLYRSVISFISGLKSLSCLACMKPSGSFWILG